MTRTITIELTEEEAQHVVNSLESCAVKWRREGRDGYAYRDNQMAARIRGELEKPILGGD